MMEMRESGLRWLLRLVCMVPSARSAALNAALRVESGQFYSLTARWILEHYYGVRIGHYSYGGCFVPEAFPAGVTIGRYASIGPGVRAFLRDHPLDRLSTHPFFYNKALGFVVEDNIDSGTLEVGHDAWVGADVKIVRGCSRIGVGAAIGAGSIVTKDIPDFAVAVGIPARVIRMRFNPETCALILASRWWERPVSACVAHLSAMRSRLGDSPEQHPLLATAGAIGRVELRA